MRTHILATVCLAIGLAGASRAQTVYAFDPTLTVTELSGPPGPPCGYPTGPVNFLFPTGAGLCPGPGAFGAPMGDIASNPVTDTLYVTDGATIFAYSRFGVPLGIAAPPIGGLTGLGMGVGGLLWITNGVMYGAVPTAAIGCPGVALFFAIGPFPVPIGPIFAGPITDIDFESTTGSLIACDGAGTVGSFMPGPAPVVGPYGFFPMPPPCALGAGLTGIAFDKALPGTGTFYVTNGVMLRRSLPFGAPPPPTFYAPIFCTPIPAGAPVCGLAYAGRMITYGAGADSAALPVPVIGSIGQSLIGNPAFAVTLAGSIPGSHALLRTAFAAACPASLVRGVPFYLGGRPFLGASGPHFLMSDTTVGAGGGAVVPSPIPATLPPGTRFFAQWLVLTPVSFQVTAGAELTTRVL